MFATSMDILNLVLAVCIAVLTFFLCLAIYYFVMSVKRINRIAKRIESGVTKVEEVVSIAKNKLKNSSTYLLVLSEIAKKALEYIQEKRTERRETKTSDTKTSKKK